MLKKSFFAVLILLSFILISLTVVSNGTKNTAVQTLINNNPPGELCYYYKKDGYPHTFYYTDSITIQRFHNVIISKDAVKISDLPSEDNVVLKIDYGQKGSTIYIDTDGSAYISEDVADIRNRSILHWLWWKIEAPDKAYFIYKTEPDRNLLELSQNIKSEIENLKK